MTTDVAQRARDALDALIAAEEPQAVRDRIAYCIERGIDPFDIVADGGIEAWMAVTPHNLRNPSAPTLKPPRPPALELLRGAADLLRYEVGMTLLNPGSQGHYAKWVNAMMAVWNFVLAHQPHAAPPSEDDLGAIRRAFAAAVRDGKSLDDAAALAFATAQRLRPRAPEPPAATVEEIAGIIKRWVEKPGWQRNEGDLAREIAALRTPAVPEEIVRDLPLNVIEAFAKLGEDDPYAPQRMAVDALIRWARSAPTAPALPPDVAALVERARHVSAVIGDAPIYEIRTTADGMIGVANPYVWAGARQIARDLARLGAQGKEHGNG